MTEAEQAGARYYEEPALRKWPHYKGAYRDMDEAEARAKFAELCEYFAIAEQHYDLPPYGICGTRWTMPDQDTREILAQGMYLLAAKVSGKPRSEYNCFEKVQRLVKSIRQQAVRDYLLQKVDDENAAYQAANDRQRYVYFVAGETGPIKIGVAVNPQKRLSGLQTSHPIPLAILALTPGGVDLEREYHERFAEHRLRGEWFDRAPAIIAEIERLAA